MSHNIAIEKGLESKSFNMGSSPVDIPTNIWEALKCVGTPELCERVKKDNLHYATVGDPISATQALTGTNRTKYYAPRGPNPHSLDNFKMPKTPPPKDPPKK